MKTFWIYKHAVDIGFTACNFRPLKTHVHATSTLGWDGGSQPIREVFTCVVSTFRNPQGSNDWIKGCQSPVALTWSTLVAKPPGHQSELRFDAGGAVPQTELLQALRAAAKDVQEAQPSTWPRGRRRSGGRTWKPVKVRPPWSSQSRTC